MPKMQHPRVNHDYSGITISELFTLPDESANIPVVTGYSFVTLYP